MTTPPEDERLANLSAWAESDDPTVTPGASRHSGQSSRAAAQAMLAAAATGDPDHEQAVQRAVGGRPALSSQIEGESPFWSLRVSPELDSAMRRQAKAEGVSLSQLVRIAVEDYLTRHAD